MSAQHHAKMNPTVACHCTFSGLSHDNVNLWLFTSDEKYDDESLTRC